QRNAARYLIAHAKANQGKWSDAATLFETLHRDYPRLQPYHAYNAARCRLRAGQAEAALQWAARVPAGTVPQAEAALVRLEALRVLGRSADVADEAAAYLTTFPSGPRRIEAMFRRAEVRRRRGRVPPARERRPARQGVVPGRAIVGGRRRSAGRRGPLRARRGGARRPQLRRRRAAALGRAGRGRGRVGERRQDPGR